MPIEYRDWYRNWFYRGQHPPTCSCAECTRKRLGKPPESGRNSSNGLLPLEVKCPVCRKNLQFDSGDLLWRCKNTECRRVYTHKDLFPDKTEKATNGEKSNVVEVKSYEEPQKPEKLEGKVRDEKRESWDEFITKLLYKKNSWDVSIMDLSVVSLAIFAMLMLYIIFLG